MCLVLTGILVANLIVGVTAYICPTVPDKVIAISSQEGGYKE